MNLPPHRSANEHLPLATPLLSACPRQQQTCSVISALSPSHRQPMAPLLFIAPCPLQAPTKQSKTCLRRPRTFACASKPEEHDREIGEPTWMNLARDIAPSDSDDPQRPPPKWQYPEGDPSILKEDQQNPWRTWKAAIENEPQVEQRDPKAETDFWRSAAKELADESAHSQDSKSPQTIPSRPDDILTDEPPKSEDVWQMARGVTGEMTELQEKLRSELERYNPDEKTDQYRDIARELVGPPEDPWENTDPIRSSQTEAQAGSGWNPDVDWMRFDDVGRKQRKEADKHVRVEAERVAKEQMETVNDVAPERTTAGDDSGQEGFDGVDQELTRTFTDQSVDEWFIQETPTEKLPGFLTNRLRRSGTYGGGWSGAEEEARNLQEQGIPLRDPQADTNKWRSVAKELNLGVEAGSEKSKDIAGEPQERSDTAQSDIEGELDDVANEIEEVTLEGSGKQESSAGGDEESSWSSWRSGSANWEAANEKAKPRDPAKEVDMWRSSARDLTSNAPGQDDSAPAVPSEVKATDTTSENAGSAWDQWRSANSKWESSLSASSEGSGSMSGKEWGNRNQSDWGAGLGGKATSERSAWEQWNNVSGMTADSGSSHWWKNRTDFAGDSVDKPDRSFNNADEWRSIARETLNMPKEEVDTARATREERIEKDATLDSWRSIAKDLTEDHE